MPRTSMQVKVALRKQRRPDLYCPEPGCLWNTGGGYCPRHEESRGRGLALKQRLQELNEWSNREGKR